VTAQIADSYYAFQEFVRTYIASKCNPTEAVTVGDAKAAWAAQCSATLTIMDITVAPWAEITDDSKDDWLVCGMLDGWPGEDGTCTDVDPDVCLDLRVGARPECICHDAIGAGRPPRVPCPTAGCVYQLDWTYEGPTNEDTGGSWTWADASQSGLYNPGYTGSYFGASGTNYEYLAHPGTRLPIEAGQTLELTLLGNNRSGSPDASNSQYVVSWYTAADPVNASSSGVILTTGAGNAWVEYNGSLVAPAGTAGFSIRMPRQSGQDDVTLCVSDAA
jgi:hypothetical protein